MVLPLLPLVGMLSAAVPYASILSVAVPFAGISPLVGIVPAAMPLTSMSKPLFSALSASMPLANTPSFASMLFSPSLVSNIHDPSEFVHGMADIIAHMAVKATVGAEKTSSTSDTTIGLGMNGTDGSVRLTLAQYMSEMPPHFSEQPDDFLVKVFQIAVMAAGSGVVKKLLPPAIDALIDAAGFGKLGPRANSVASWVQSNYYGDVPAGSVFAQLQSHAMTR